MKKDMHSPDDPKFTAALLTVDDDPNILSILGMRLRPYGYRILQASNGREALKRVKETPVDLAVIDYKLNDRDGISLMEEMRDIQPDLPVIILTAHGSIGTAVDAVKRGACNFLTKPFDGEELVRQIAVCIQGERPAYKNGVADIPDGPEGLCSGIIARSKGMKELIAHVIQAAHTDSNVYIEGESGTGKELIARCLHNASNRRTGPFIAVNCAAIPENLLESEMFGYEKGAFTGADHGRQGLFTSAHGGTFFFDEITELPLSMQAKLLRVLEEQEYYPLGSNQKIKVNVRILAASNANLEERISQGLFRKDLFYRIRVIPLQIPPLRKRKEDILPLAKHFLCRFNAKTGKAIKDISKEGIRKLMKFNWPGNVRELENVMEYAVVMAKSRVITPDPIMGRLSENTPHKLLKDAKNTFEKDYLIELLEIHNGNISHAAETAGKHRADLYDLLRKHELNPQDFRAK